MHNLKFFYEVVVTCESDCIAREGSGACDPETFEEVSVATFLSTNFLKCVSYALCFPFLVALYFGFCNIERVRNEPGETTSKSCGTEPLVKCERSVVFRARSESKTHFYFQRLIRPEIRSPSWYVPPKCCPETFVKSSIPFGCD